MATGVAEAMDGTRTLDDAFAREARRGVRLAAVARGIAFLLLWASYCEDALGNWRNPYFQYRSALVAVALVSGVLTWVAAGRSRRPVAWCAVFLILDLLVIVLLVFGWLPPMIADYPQFLAVRQQDVLLFVVILSASALPLSPRLVTGAGLGAAAIWVAAVLQSFWRTPGAVTADSAAAGAKGWGDVLVRTSKPLVLNTDDLVLEGALLFVIAALLMVGVREGRRMVGEAVRAEAGRARFARFMPPGVLAALGAQGGALAPRRGEACILFADFDRSAPMGLEALGRFYAAVEAAVFDQGGVIDRFVGDAAMASFGAIADEGDAAARAPACAEGLAAMPEVAVVAVHRGPVVSGEVGSARQRAFGVVGDTVNAARRLMDWARGRGLRIAVSGAMPGASGLEPQGEARLRGLDVPLTVRGRA